MSLSVKKYVPKPLRSAVRRCVNRISSSIALRPYIKEAFSPAARNTSMSDGGYYPLVCYLASKHESVFRDFRKNRIYRAVLEHVTEKEGREYLDVIGQYGLLTFKDWQDFIRNDFVGSPDCFTYSILGNDIRISPTTIRYAKVLCDILSLFDAGDIKSIAEIGIGYGGQCRIIRSKIPEATYTLIDLPEVIGLAEKYLSNYEECRENIRYVDGGHMYLYECYDLVISNYAFSELQRQVQDMYMNKVILKSKRGYITYNPLSNRYLDGYSDDELLEKIPGSVKLEERPLTFKGNCIIAWGTKN